MTQYPHDEFDDVPVDGPRQGAHRGHHPAVRVGAKELAAIVVAGALTLGVGAFAHHFGPGGSAAGSGVSAPAP